jgi:hypothetical protein
MANQPAIIATVKITALDINGNHTTKQFNSVYGVNFDYNKGMMSITDATGEFYFSLGAVVTFTNVIVGGVVNFHTITVQ